MGQPKKVEAPFIVESPPKPQLQALLASPCIRLVPDSKPTRLSTPQSTSTWFKVSNGTSQLLIRSRLRIRCILPPPQRAIGPNRRKPFIEKIVGDLVLAWNAHSDTFQTDIQALYIYIVGIIAGNITQGGWWKFLMMSRVQYISAVLYFQIRGRKNTDRWCTCRQQWFLHTVHRPTHPPTH